METNTRSVNIIRWTARILAIVFAAFISIFALDVFTEDHESFWKTTTAVIMHLIPTLFIALTVIIAWNKEWVGAIVFMLLALIHIITKWGQFDWSVYALIDGPLILLSILFFISWLQRKKNIRT